MLHRRLARDYETLPTRSEAMIHLAMTDLMTRRLTGESTISWRDPAPQTKQHSGIKHWEKTTSYCSRRLIPRPRNPPSTSHRDPPYPRSRPYCVTPYQMKQITESQTNRQRLILRYMRFLHKLANFVKNAKMRRRSTKSNLLEHPAPLTLRAECNAYYFEAATQHRNGRCYLYGKM